MFITSIAENNFDLFLMTVEKWILVLNYKLRWFNCRLKLRKPTQRFLCFVSSSNVLVTISTWSKWFISFRSTPKANNFHNFDGNQNYDGISTREVLEVKLEKFLLLLSEHFSRISIQASLCLRET